MLKRAAKLLVYAALASALAQGVGYALQAGAPSALLTGAGGAIIELALASASAAAAVAVWLLGTIVQAAVATFVVGYVSTEFTAAFLRAAARRMRRRRGERYLYNAQLCLLSIDHYCLHDALSRVAMHLSVPIDYKIQLLNELSTLPFPADPSVLRAALDHGLDPNTVDAGGTSLLRAARRGGKAAFVELLVERGARDAPE